GAAGAPARSFFIFGSPAGSPSGFATEGSSDGVAGSIRVQGTDFSSDGTGAADAEPALEVSLASPATTGPPGTQSQHAFEVEGITTVSPRGLHASNPSTAVPTSQTGTDLQLGRWFQRSIQRPAKAVLNGVKTLRLTTIASRTHDLNGLDIVQQRSRLQSIAPQIQRQPEMFVAGCKATQLLDTTVAKATDWIN
ncbi:MAG: hypothetical protein ACK52S_11730, partial [Pirellula sp.]